MSYIAKFNPYTMDDSTILALATGRKRLLHQVLNTLKDNISTTSIAQHLIIRAPRGMGKSFFLKYLKIHFNKDKLFNNSEFLLLPEEQSNVNTPADLIKLILNQLENTSSEEAIAMWEEPDDIWQKELKHLTTYIKEKKSNSKDYILVVVIENLDELLKNIKSDKKRKKINESRFRYLLEKIENLTIIGATTRINTDAIDGDYNKRLFHAFKRYSLRRWNEEDYFNYFNRRKDYIMKELGVEFTPEQLSIMKAKLKAISKFTGGSPRMAVVLTDLLLKDDVISTSKTLFGLIDDLTPYYQDLTKRIPKKSKILFDTLIRKGENLSQSELAKILGATQSQISQAFTWLKDEGYLIGNKRKNSRVFSYQVADRIHVLYYQQREINHNKNLTHIWLLSDFLVSFYQEGELYSFANRYLKERPGPEANDMAKLYLMASGIGKNHLPNFDDSNKMLNYIKQKADKEYYRYFKKAFIFEIERNYTAAIENYQKAYELRKKEKNVSEQALNLGRIGWNLQELKKYKEAIKYHQKAYELWKEEKNISEQAWNLGHIGENLILLGEWGEVEKLFDTKFRRNDLIFKELGDAVIHTERTFGITKAFETGNRLLLMLRDCENLMDKSHYLSLFFANLLQMKISSVLFMDLAEEALVIFSQQDVNIVIGAALHTVKYIESGKNPEYLENLNPDTVIAIKAIIEEGAL